MKWKKEHSRKVEEVREEKKKKKRLRRRDTTAVSSWEWAAKGQAGGGARSGSKAIQKL